MNPRRTAARDFLRALFERRPDPYEGAELDPSRRVVAALLALTAGLSILFLPVEPVDEQIGGAGWVVAGALIAAGLAGAAAVIRRSPSFEHLLAIGYAGVAAVAVLNWLAGGGSSAYEDLYVLWLGAAAVHPPRRALTLIAVMLGFLALPLLYEGASGDLVRDMVAEASILMAVGAILVSYLQYVRRERVGLLAGVEVARRLASVDALTGLGNRRAFDEAITVEALESVRDGRPISVALVDVTGLKRINDRHGQLEGDRCLLDVARTLEGSVRSTDRCFRWGGDEFVVVLPGSTRADADDVLRRVAHNVGERCEDPDGRGLELTCAAAELSPGASPEEVLAAADVALLERKTEKRR